MKKRRRCEGKSRKRRKRGAVGEGRGGRGGEGGDEGGRAGVAGRVGGGKEGERGVVFRFMWRRRSSKEMEVEVRLQANPPADSST